MSIQEITDLTANLEIPDADDNEQLELNFLQDPDTCFEIIDAAVQALDDASIHTAGGAGDPEDAVDSEDLLCLAQRAMVYFCMTKDEERFLDDDASVLQKLLKLGLDIDDTSCFPSSAAGGDEEPMSFLEVLCNPSVVWNSKHNPDFDFEEFKRQRGLLEPASLVQEVEEEEVEQKSTGCTKAKTDCAADACCSSKKKKQQEEQVPTETSSCTKSKEDCAEDGCCDEEEDSLAFTEAEDAVTANMIKALLAAGHDVLHPANEIALHKLLDAGAVISVKVLIAAGADVNALVEIGTPLEVAASNKNVAGLKVLLEHKADPNTLIQGEMQDCVMMSYSEAMFGEFEMFEALLDAGMKVPADLAIRCVDKDCQFAVQIIKMLVEHKYDVNAKTDTGFDLLEAALEIGYLEVVQYLHEKQNVSLDNEGQTRLMQACAHPDVVKYLLSKGVTVQVPEGGTCVISMCMQHDHTEVTDMLLEAGADIEHQDVEGLTAIADCAMYGTAGSVKAMIERKASTADQNGLSLLYYHIYRYDNDDVSPEEEFEEGKGEEQEEEEEIPMQGGAGEKKVLPCNSWQGEDHICTAQVLVEAGLSTAFTDADGVSWTELGAPTEPGCKQCYEWLVAKTAGN